jgi:hypothetical protein
MERVNLPEASMPSSDVMQRELADIEQKLASARRAADAPGASERDKADLKLLEQEYLAARRKASRERGSGTEGQQPSGTKQKVDKKLDEALEASFPGSDPVSFSEPAPVKERTAHCRRSGSPISRRRKRRQLPGKPNEPQCA